MAEFKRSRLNRKSEEQITRKTVVLGFFTILLFALIIVYGLPFLIKFSLFLGDTKTRLDGSESEVILPPLAPRLVVPFEATNSSKINISGLAESNLKVELLKNEVSIGETQVSESSEFIFKNIELNEGENVFTAITKTEKGGTSPQSTPVTVLYDTKSPDLTMINPSETDLTVDYADFDIVGKSENGVSVLVNNRVAMVDDEGRFKIKVQLNAGKNNIEIKVKDEAGNESKRELVITYDF